MLISKIIRMQQVKFFVAHVDEMKVNLVKMADYRHVALQYPLETSQWYRSALAYLFMKKRMV